MRTVKDLDNAFKLYLDQADAQGTAKFLPEERAQFLNDAQLWLARKHSADKEDNQDSVDLRRTLSTPLSLTVTKGIATLPTNFLNHGRLVCVLAAPYKGVRTQPTVIDENRLSQVLYNDPFNEPAVHDTSVCYLNNSVLVFPATGVASLEGSYYRMPAELLLSTPSQVPDIAPALLPTLVQRAVQLCLESIADSRVSSQAQISTLTEQ